jgi:hypothetical protein
MAAEVQRIDLDSAQKVFGLIISVPNIFWGVATRPTSSTYLSPGRYQVIDRLPKAWCLGLSQRHYACKGAPLTSQAIG